MNGTPSSAIYEGEVMHHRLRPRRHRFVYTVQSFLFDVDSIARLSRRCRLFSVNHFNLFSLHYRDFGDGTAQTPRRYLETTLREQGLDEPLTRAELLCYPRILGYAFNPLAVYYCYGADNQLFAMLYEVSNTFGQRHSYLLPVAKGQRDAEILRQQCDKAFYVSPFISMDCCYHFRMRRPGERLMVAIRQTENGDALLHAVLRGQRRPFSDRELLKGFFRLPLMTLKVTAAIHWQALKLVLKGIKLVPRPPEPSSSVSRIDP